MRWLDRKTDGGQARWKVAIVLVAASITMYGGDVAAQEAPPSLQFSLSNPGARAMGLGGAFVALADDATAAFANPAGLVQLVRPEISLEYRWRQYTTPYTEGGRASGSATGYGIDTVDGIRTGSSKESTEGLSFASFVYPGGRWSVAVYRHQQADFTMRTELNGLFGIAEEGGVRRDYDQVTTTQFEIVNYGVSGALQVTESLSLGLGFSYFEGLVDVAGASYLVDLYPETLMEANSFFANRVFQTSQFLSDDSDWGINVGLLWSFAPNWRFGGVYRQGPDLVYGIENRAGPAHWEPEGSDVGSISDRQLSFPDVFGAGVAYRSPSGNLTVGFEWDRVEYSVILETLDSELVDTSDVSLEDANELHLGVEYVFLDVSPLIAVRAGVWSDPDHRFSYVGPDPFERALYPPGKDLVHFSIGAGIAFRRFQIDLGADFSDAVDQIAVSGIFSF